MRIMHGMREVAGQAYYAVRGLRDAGHDATIVLWDESPFGYPYDICMKMDRGKKYLYPVYGAKLVWNAVKCAFRYDSFHFHFGHSLIPKNLDLPFLRLLGKRIFFEFHGSDIRQKSIACTHNPYWKGVSLPNEVKLKARAEKLAGYARGFIIHDEELNFYMPENVNVYTVPLRVDIEKFRPCYPDPGKESVTIVHAPSDRGVKGTEFVNGAVERLSQRYDIDYVLVEGLTQEEAFRKYMEADIIVDQLMAGTYGVFAIEGMMMGKPVVTYVTDEMRSYFPEELPLVSANPDDIEGKLEQLICNGKMRHSLGRRGRDYALKYHDCRKCGQVLWDVYNGKITPLRGKEAFAYTGDKG